MLDVHNIAFYRNAIKSLRTNDLNAHNPSNTNVAHLLCEVEKWSPYRMGGQAHSSWVAGILFKGVWLHAYNYEVAISVSSDPNAIWKQGCQDSRTYGSPYPHTDDPDVHWVGYNILPEDIKLKVDKILIEIYNHIEEVIEKKIAQVEQQEANRQQRESMKQQKFLDNWKD